MQISFRTILSLAAMFIVSSAAHAGIVVTNVGAGVDPSTGSFQKITPQASDLEADGTLASIALAGGGSIDTWFGGHGSTTNGLVPISEDDGQLHSYSWWDSDTYPLYSTGVPSGSSSIWIDLSNVNAFGFSFQVAANMRSTGWFKVFYDAPDSPLRERNFAISPNSGNSNFAPGFQVSNSGGSCQRISKIQVDPDPFVWGIFNMGIDTTGGACTSVPEPDSLGLIALGLVGLGLVRVNQGRRRSQRREISTA